MKKAEKGLEEEELFTVPAIKALADMLDPGETRAHYKKRRRSNNIYPQELNAKF